MKTVWISALQEKSPLVAPVTAALQRYGLGCQGHFWVDMPEKLAWKVALDEALAAKTDLWLILATPEEWAKPSVRYGLSLFASAFRAARGAILPILILGLPAETSLPDLLAHATLIADTDTAWPAKAVARANAKPVADAAPYRLRLHGDERLGQWVELSPKDETWQGMVFGLAGGEGKISFQAVGPSGALPAKTTLEYAQENMEIAAAERKFVAWALRNRIEPGSSYYARIAGIPEALLFMPYSEEESVEATILRLA